MGKLYERLDEEQRALHDSWPTIVRMLLVVPLLAATVWGLCAGLRWAVHEATERLHHWLDGERAAIGAAALAALLVAGAVVRGLLLRRPAWRDTAGDGINVALDNFHSTYRTPADDVGTRYRRPAFGLALRKAAATLLTLGTGGSGGLEAPVVVAGEAIGAGYARVFQVASEAELRTYQLAGIAAAVGTLLGAPFTAALFAIEIAYGDRIIYRKFAYALLAAMVAFALDERVVGGGPLFVAPAHGEYSVAEYAITVLVAVAVSAPVALGFGVLTAHAAALVGRAAGVLRSVAGAVGTAAVAIALWLAADLAPHHVLGMGEHTLAELLSGASPAWWVLGLLVVGKMLTTGFTIGSGGSAGMLIPAMFLGGVSGRLTAELLELAGLAPAGMAPEIFVVVGIASALVAMIGVPLAAIALVLEVFGPAYGPAAALSCAMTYVFTLRIKVYEAQRMSPDPDADETGP